MDPKIEKRFKNVMKSEAFMNILETFGLSEKKVLDVGCAFGEYLANFGMGSVGLTVVDEEVEFGKKILRKKMRVQL
jgi:2-polyprenyl-3-methyl-5-hydroxy-6-metoxy-1,4-benzoquinol methylase